MFFKKLKEENKSLEKKVSRLKAELSDAQASMAEMRKLLIDKHAKHTEADVAQAMRNAIVRQCEQIGEKSFVVLGGQICPTNPDSYEILHLVEAYNKLNNACIIDTKNLLRHEAEISFFRHENEGAAHD